MSQGHPMMSQDVPKPPKDIPWMSQSHPRVSQEVPKPPKDVPEMSQGHPRVSQDVPRCPKATRTLQLPPSPPPSLQAPPSPSPISSPGLSQVLPRLSLEKRKNLWWPHLRGVWRRQWSGDQGDPDVVLESPGVGGQWDTRTVLLGGGEGCEFVVATSQGGLWRTMGTLWNRSRCSYGVSGVGGTHGDLKSSSGLRERAGIGGGHISEGFVENNGDTLEGIQMQLWSLWGLTNPRRPQNFSQHCPEVLPGCPQVLPGSPRLSPGSPRFSQDCPQVLPGSPRSSQVLPGCPRFSQVLPGSTTFSDAVMESLGGPKPMETSKVLLG
nr:uncharacterized protein LOC113460794 isoform X3 [Zonotrichia albicollis]